MLRFGVMILADELALASQAEAVGRDLPGMLRFGVVFFAEELVLANQAGAVGRDVSGGVERGEIGAAGDVCQPGLPTNGFVGVSTAGVGGWDFVSLFFRRNGSEGRRYNGNGGCLVVLLEDDIL